MTQSSVGADDRPIAERRARLDALRPLDPASLRALDAWYDVELTWSSNAVGGNSLTRIETAIVLEKGITIGGKPLKDHLETIDHSSPASYRVGNRLSAARSRENGNPAQKRSAEGRPTPLSSDADATLQGF